MRILENTLVTLALQAPDLEDLRTNNSHTSNGIDINTVAVKHTAISLSITGTIVVTIIAIKTTGVS